MFNIINLKKPTADGSSMAAPAFMLALILAVILANAVWLFVDRQPFAWDESIHYMGALGYYHLLSSGGPLLFKKLLYLSNFYPPVAEFLGGCWFLLTKPSPHAAAFSNVFYVTGIVCLLYLLGKREFGKETGVLAAYFFAASSAIGIQSKFFMLDIPLAFFVILGYYVFSLSENFSSRRWSVVYGLILGLGIMVKWSALFFLAFPPLVAGVAAALSANENRRKIWLNVLLAYAVTALLAAPWYSVHFIALVKNTSGYIYQRGVIKHDPGLLSPGSWFYYTGSVLKQTSIPMGLALLVGLAWYFVRGKNRLWTAVWLAIPYIILMLIRNKDHRYIIPMLPLICLAGTTWVQSLTARSRERWLLILALAALAQMAYVHLGARLGWLHGLTRAQVFQLPVIDSMGPDGHEWPIGAILADVENRGRQLGRKPELRVIPDDYHFSRVTFVVEQSRQKGGVDLSATSNWPFFTDFAVTKTGSLAPDFNLEFPKKISEELAAGALQKNPRFELLQKYPLPDGSEALLYGRREVPADLPAAQIMEVLQAKLQELLSAYLAHTQTCSIEVEPFSEQETRLGRFKRIRIFSEHGTIGDFKHKDFGLPFDQIDTEVQDITLDVEQLLQGKLIVYALGKLKLNQAVFSENSLNQAFSQARDNLRSLRVNCQQETITASWLGLVPVQARVALKVIPDPEHASSSNLRFSLLSLRAGFLPVPGWLLQPLLEDFNPVLKLAGLPAEVNLGQLQIDKGELRLGTK